MQTFYEMRWSEPAALIYPHDVKDTLTRPYTLKFAVVGFAYIDMPSELPDGIEFELISAVVRARL